MPNRRDVFRRLGAVSCPILLLLLPAALWAQPTAPVYTTYEGWKANDDGTFTLVFGYHNANPVAVDIPAGADNGFTPGPADRGQPTTFLPGRQRSVCRMVVGPDFEGNLQWGVTWAGQAGTTTERGGLDELYLLEEIGPGYRAAEEIDTSTAPRGVCLNRTPVVRTARRMAATSGEPARLRAAVADDGLPRGSHLELHWEKVSGPGEVTFADAASASTEARFSTAGSYEIRLSASDGTASGEATVNVTVSDHP